MVSKNAYEVTGHWPDGSVETIVLDIPDNEEEIWSALDRYASAHGREYWDDFSVECVEETEQ